MASAAVRSKAMVLVCLLLLLFCFVFLDGVVIDRCIVVQYLVLVLVLQSFR